jgi:hypothetical protein
MKTLPPAPSRLGSLTRRSDLALSVAEPIARPEILGALAEILLAAAEVVERKEERDEAP